MLQKLFGRAASSPVRHPIKATPLIPERDASHRPQNHRENNKQVFSKVFRYRLPEGRTHEPKIVEVAGTFNHWQKVPLVHNGKLDGWHVTIHHIPGNRTHHYMMLIDGEATMDHSCDGLVPPHGHVEEHFVLNTERGPRVLMLFAQTK